MTEVHIPMLVRRATVELSANRLWPQGSPLRMLAAAPAKQPESQRIVRLAQQTLACAERGDWDGVWQIWRTV